MWFLGFGRQMMIIIHRLKETTNQPILLLDKDDLLTLVLISIQNLPILEIWARRMLQYILCDRLLVPQKKKITKKNLVEKP